MGKRGIHKNRMDIHGNRGRRRRTAVVITALILVFQVPLQGRASPVGRAEKEKSQAEAARSQAEDEADQLEDKLKDSRKQEQVLEDELTRLLTMKDILASDMDDLNVQIDQANRDYGKAEESRLRQYDILKKRIQFLYEEGDITYLDILLKARGIGDVVSQTEYFRQLYEYDQDMIRRYENTKAEAARQKEQLEEKQSQLEVMNEEYRTQQTELEGYIQARKQESSNFAQELEDARARAARAAAEVKQKTEEIRMLRAAQDQERIRREQEAALAQENGAGDGENNGPGSRTPVKSTGGTRFGRSVADYALQFVGNPYVYGGTSLTNGTDCSGFTQSVYRHFGVNIPRTSGEQAGFGQVIPYGDMEPGDLVCYSGHVAMYIGDGRIVHASSRKEGIKVSGDPAYRTIVSIRRPWNQSLETDIKTNTDEENDGGIQDTQR